MAKTTASRFLSPSPPASASSFPTPLPPATDPRQLYHSCACSSLSTEQSCTDGRSLPKRVSSEVAVSFKSRIKALRSLSAPNPSRFQSIITHRRTNSESCASSAFPARSMNHSNDSRDFKILMALLTVKNARYSASWNASDDLVRRRVLSLLERSCEIDDCELKQRIEEFERKVQRHKERTEEIVENKGVLLDLFDYVTPGDVIPPTQLAPSNAKKRTPYFLDDGAIQCCSKRACCSASASYSSESIGQQLARLLDQRATLQDILTGPLSMEHCVDKLQKCGLSESELWKAIDMLKADIELRQVVIKLENSEARGYIMHLMSQQL